MLPLTVHNQQHYKSNNHSDCHSSPWGSFSFSSYTRICSKHIINRQQLLDINIFASTTILITAQAYQITVPPTTWPTTAIRSLFINCSQFCICFARKRWFQQGLLLTAKVNTDPQCLSAIEWGPGEQNSSADSLSKLCLYRATVGFCTSYQPTLYIITTLTTMAATILTSQFHLQCTYSCW